MVPSMTSLSETLWAPMRPYFDAVLEHPFLAGLADGTLPRDTFAHYIVQDAHYLQDYARALALVATKAPASPTTATPVTTLFARHAADALDVERSLHAGLFVELGLDPATALAGAPGPTTLAYTSYLLRVGHQGSFTDALAAVLPCYWIYERVGTTLATRSSTDPLYARWIATYGGADFGEAVAQVLTVVDAVGEVASAAQIERMCEHAGVTARYEWMFWDAAWRREGWPI